MDEEKRRRYRLSTEGLDPLRVELIPAEGEPLLAEVTDGYNTKQWYSETPFVLR